MAPTTPTWRAGWKKAARITTRLRCLYPPFTDLKCHPDFTSKAMTEVQTRALDARFHNHLALADGWQSNNAAPGAQMTGVVIGVVSPALLHGLESLVIATPGLRLLGTGTTPESFLKCCQDARDGVAVVDPLLGGKGLRPLLVAMKAAAPRLHAVLMMATHQAQVVREGVEAGARGFITKDADMQEIRDAIQAVAQGQRHFSAAVAAQLAESMSVAELTPREMQVLSLLCKGACNKQIARELDVAVGTVKTHVAAIMFKLSSRSRTEAVLRAGQLGLMQFA